MRFSADVHLHSRYSRATSKDLDLERLFLGAKLKGIQVVGTGDAMHPRWLDEIEEKLEPAESGLYSLKPEYRRIIEGQVPASCAAPVRFLLSVEISNIYKRRERVRKVHNCVFLPDFAAARRLQARLERIGNIASDGRPILGLDSRDLLELVLDSSPQSYLIPAHIWTPWFSALGSKSGFDSIEECYGDLSGQIFALETGLSSDPPMNWRLSRLDPYALVSNSDAHSPRNLGREATLYDTELSFDAIRRALADPLDPGLAGTIEFFPEEGKYHFDGHRLCKARLSPEETARRKGLCPVCGAAVTIGVLSRVEELADRPAGERGGRARPFTRLVPLAEIAASSLGLSGSETKSVGGICRALVESLGSELSVLIESSLDDIARVAGERIAEGIGRVRAGEVEIAPGYDGEYGVVRLFPEAESAESRGQLALF